MDLAELLFKILEISHSNIDINARINGILKVLGRNLKASEAAIYVLERDKRLTLKYMSEKSPVTVLLAPYRPFVGEGIAGSVAQTREAQFFSIQNIPKRFGFLLHTELDNVISMYARFAFLPLSDESKCYGVLLVFSSAGFSFSEPEKKILELTAKELTGLLKTNELYMDSKRRITELMTLSEIGKVLISNRDLDSILKDTALIVAKTMEADFVHLILREKNGEKPPKSATYGETTEDVKVEIKRVEERVIREKRPLFNHSITGYTIYSAPIVSKGQILGAISMCKITERQSIGEEEGYYLLDTISNYLSSGLENIMLRSQLRDILEELNSAHERILEQEKLRSLGEMTANIAHEIKNPLLVIGGFAKRLAKKIQLNPPEKRYLNIILREVGRLEAILGNILSYAKEVPLKRSIVSLDEVLTELIHLFKSDPLWEGIEITKEVDPDIPPVYCDPEQIKQVFVNILVNAYEAMAGEGKIEIRLFKRNIMRKDYVAVSISDTGGGIDPLIIDNIFNPFFTTKEKGTGLGLSISNKIVLNHRGKIEVQNQKGIGATFIVYLPAHEYSTSPLQNGKMP